MAVRCPECGELAYRHPTRRRGRICSLTPPQAFRRAQEWRDDVRRMGAFTPSEARLVEACPMHGSGRGDLWSVEAAEAMAACPACRRRT